MLEHTLNLFKAVEIKANSKKKIPSKRIMEITLEKGFIFAPEVIGNYTEYELIEMVKVLKSFGLSPKEMNSSFHKSWNKVKTASIEQLVIEQIIHYITTYGFEALGIYSEDSVYIPNEKLEIPALTFTEDINIVIIKGYTKKELKEKLLGLSSGVALGQDTVKYVTELLAHVGITDKELQVIKNREVKIGMYDKLGKVPENALEFLRYAIYKSTGKTLLIKDRSTIDAIKERDYDALPLFVRYRDEHGLKGLSEIFYRFKPIFLAFRTQHKMNSIINKTRKLAVKNHKPMKEDYLNSVTSKIKKGEKIKKLELLSNLERVNTFRKIRLAYALKFRTKDDADSILYKVRNGKGYATDFIFEDKKTAKRVFDLVLTSIVDDIKQKVENKKIYIPDHMNYAIPATEKQFTGDLPSGTYVAIPKDMIVGIHWYDVGHKTIDLDLSLINTAGKIGWDSAYRNEERSILFSGDVTAAPKPEGASELFYVKRQKKDAHILMVNYYNYDEAVEVPFNIFVAKEQTSNLKQNYMVDPNNVMSIAKTNMDKKQKILGLLVTTTNECRFYYTECYLGNSITSSSLDYVQNTRKYLFDFYRNTIDLRDVLKKAGAVIVNDKAKCDIDLSPETLEKDKIINLLR